MKTIFKLALSLFLALGVFSGCSASSGGAEFLGKEKESDIKKHLVVGKTTKDDIFKRWGKPQNRLDNRHAKKKNTEDIYSYQYQKSQAGYTAFIPLPVSASKSESIIKYLYLGFDKNDKLTEYWFEEYNNDSTSKSLY